MFNKKNSVDEVGKNDFKSSVGIFYQELQNKRHNPLTKEQEYILMSKAKEGNIKARNTILDSNQRFVFEIAKIYRGKGVDINDLISVGNEGMIKAIEKFDMSRDVKFFSYAVWHIRQKMARLIQKHKEQLKQEVRYDDYFPYDENNFENISFEDDESLENKNVSTFKPDMYENNYEKNEENEEKKIVVNKLLGQLGDREKTVIQMFFGINSDEQTYSLEEIGKRLNLSTERIRQIKIKAIDEMRNNVFDVKAANFLFK